MTYSKKKTAVYFSEEGYDKYANFYDHSLPFLDTFEQGYFQWLNRDLKNKKVLDAGCGTGRNSLRLAQMGANLTAVDVSAKMLQKLSLKNNQIQTVQADITDLPFAEESFDIIVCNLVLVHILKPQEALTEFYRVLNPNGELLLTVIHQKKPPILKAGNEEFKIKSFYHNAGKIRETLENEAFQIPEERPIIEQGIKISTIFHAQK